MHTKLLQRGWRRARKSTSMKRTGDLGVCRCKFEISSRTALAISVPILLIVYLAYLIIAIFSDAIVDAYISRGSSLGGSNQVSLEATSFLEPEPEVPTAAGSEFGGEFIVLNENAPLPNKGRSPGESW